MCFAINIMRQTEDISPWRVTERNDTRDEGMEERNRELPKVVTSFGKYGNQHLSQSTPIQFTSRQGTIDFPQVNGNRGDIKKSLYLMRHGSIKEPMHRNEGGWGQSQEGGGKDKRRGSYALSTMKRTVRNDLVQQKGQMRVSRSTPFIKTRMQSLLRHFQLGVSNDKYMKQMAAQPARGQRLEGVVAKPTNIQFLYGGVKVRK